MRRPATRDESRVSADTAPARRTLFSLIAEQRRFVMLAVSLAAATGIWAAVRLPSSIYPELEFSRIAIVAQGSTLGARQQVFSVTRPIEEAVSVVPGVTRVTSRSIRGGSDVNVTFLPSVDMQVALQLVQARVNAVRTELPASVALQVERLTPSIFPIVSYNLVGGDAATLYDIARFQISPVFARVPGVGRVDVQGSSVRELEVVADPVRLARVGRTYDDLATVIRQATSVNAVGRVSRDYKQYLVVTQSEARAPDDIAAIPIGGGLRVRDVATVTLGREDRVQLVAGDGRPAALLSITRQPGGNTLRMADSIDALAAQFRKSLPAGVLLVPVYDQAVLVRDAVASVRDAMLIGAALAVCVLLAFLRSWRVTAISASVIPLTLAITVGAMSLLGQTFNLMTLGALAIAIGLVIDDAVVVTENIVRHLAMTSDRTRAIREAVQELLWPVTTSTVTTVVVFAPLRLLEGIVGQFFAALSLTLTVAVLVSLVLAFTVIPLLCAAYLPQRDTTAHEAGRIERWYDRALDRVLQHRIALGVLALLLGAGGVIAYRATGTGFLPEMDEGAFVLDYWTPGGTSLDETDRMIHQVETLLARTPAIAATARRTGAELGLFATEQNTGDMIVRLRADRDLPTDAVIGQVRDSIAATMPRLRVEFVQILSDVINDLAGASKPVEIKLFGPDLAALEAYGKVLAHDMEKVPGLEDLYDGNAEPSAELSMAIDRVETARLGVSPEQVAIAVSGALLGVPAGELRLDDRAIGVRVRAPDAVRFDPAALSSLPVITTASRDATPLGALATFTPHNARAELLRENQQQEVMLTADVAERALGDVMHDVRGVLAAHAVPAGIRLELGGQYASQQAAFASLLLVLALAAICVVAVMVIQFRSFVEPFVVLLAAPLSFVGAILALLLTGTPLNVSSFMGGILLVGLIVKNGIILLDFTDHLMRHRGLQLEPALREAARVRLRPILMTTLCTLFGLLPLALGLGTGSELQKPLALAVLGGLALSTPITLFLVPSLLMAIRGRTYTRAPG
jgi:CzcA family heavy metal efflux pump